MQDIQSRDRMGGYNYFLQEHDEVPDEGKHEGELQRNCFNCKIVNLESASNMMRSERY